MTSKLKLKDYTTQLNTSDYNIISSLGVPMTVRACDTCRVILYRILPLTKHLERTHFPHDSDCQYSNFFLRDA